MAKAATQESPAAWRNRIIGIGEESPEQLLANPRNFRIHPQFQQDALEGVLAEIGWLQDVIVNRRTGFVVDGHLRVKLAMRHHQASVPVKYVDLSEDEEALALATLDPISALAATDPNILNDLLNEASTGSAAVAQMLTDLQQTADRMMRDALSIDHGQKIATAEDGSHLDDLQNKYAVADRYDNTTIRQIMLITDMPGYEWALNGLKMIIDAQGFSTTYQAFAWLLSAYLEGRISDGADA